MKIAHINNTSGIASSIAERQRREGHQVDVFVFNDRIFRQFGGTKLNYWSPLDRWKLFRNLKGYDVWHYHYPYGSLKRSLEKRKTDRIYLKHYHGNDLRGRQEEDFCLVSTPDLLKYAPNGRWLPTPIDLEEISVMREEFGSSNKNENQENKILKVAHYPYYKNYSSLDSYSDALSRLQKEQKCEIINILNQSHSQALRIMASSDVIIGKILPNVGWFGKFELEGMALGKPVIAYVSEELYEKYKPPIYRTTKDTFKRDLETFVEDRFEREGLSHEGPRYVRNNHSLESVVETVMTWYH
jgi:glycosyltransferase involved in cell wall biosynthesis